MPTTKTREIISAAVVVATLWSASGHARAESPTPAAAQFLFAQTQGQAAPDPAPPALPPALSPTPVAAEGIALPAQTVEQAPAPQLAYKPAYKTWWFWALTAAVVGGTVALGAWAVQPVTQPARSCSPGAALCFGEGRPR